MSAEPNKPNAYESPETENTVATKSEGGFPLAKVLVLALLVIGIGVGIAFRDQLSLSALAEQESQLLAFKESNPVAVYAIAFAVYVAVTGLSLPGAAVLTLVMGWFFGVVAGTILVSFASTAGATIAFLFSRFLLRDTIQNKFGDKLTWFNEQLDRDGPFFLFTLRLVPLVPFFVINAVMGLTRIKTATFWWVSQLGMLAGTFVYVYAGSAVPNLTTLAEEGVNAVFTPSFLLQITIAFGLLGTFPLAAKKAVDWLKPKSDEAVAPPATKNGAAV
ncbi:MAG: TVP38/TMEM64 family protein [Planctomycetota bacterium]